MDDTASWAITVVFCGGVIAGMGLLSRGLLHYRATVRLGDTATSTVTSLAAGEARINGRIEAAELTLISLLQSVRCVYYRATVGSGGDSSAADPGFTEERSVGFRVSDATGSIRVFPRGARFDAPIRLDVDDGVSGEGSSGLAIRTGAAFWPGELDRAAAIAELLHVRDPKAERGPHARLSADDRRSYRESRLEIGDTVTIVGRALPFSDLDDPIMSDYGTEAERLDSDPEVAADLAEARGSGMLAADPAEAWGNAAIPGFGIGRPVTTPELDPAADRLALATTAQADRTVRTFTINAETLVLASSAEVPLLIAFGTPGAAMERSRRSYAVGLLGAVLAIVSVTVLAIVSDGGFLREGIGR